MIIQQKYILNLSQRYKFKSNTHRQIFQYITKKQKGQIFKRFKIMNPSTSTKNSKSRSKSTHAPNYYQNRILKQNIKIDNNINYNYDANQLADLQPIYCQQSNQENAKILKVQGQYQELPQLFQKKLNLVNNGKIQKQISDYIMGKTLGEGTFGKVKLAVHIPTNEKVAIKILQKKKILEVADVQRVKRQMHILKLIHHPSLVQMYEIIQTPKKLLLIMEYMENGELFQYIVKSKRIKQPEACKIFHQIINGVQYMHKLGIVHRDLKPQNIIFDYKRQIKIVDFGLGNIYKKNQKLKTPCGSPCYAAPQMIQGQKYQGLKVDIWSCGVILFAMICGYLPFQDQDVPTLYKKILACEYECHRSISDSGKDLLSKILKVNKDQRFTLEQIRNHPWMKQNMKNQQLSDQKGTIVGYQNMQVNRKVLEYMKRNINSSQLDINQVQKKLQANCHNNWTTSYYLFMKKLKKESFFEGDTKQIAQIKKSCQIQKQNKNRTTSLDKPLDRFNRQKIQNFIKQEKEKSEDKVKKQDSNQQQIIQKQKQKDNNKQNQNLVLIDNYFTKTSCNFYPQYYQITSQNNCQIVSEPNYKKQDIKDNVSSKKLDYYHSKKAEKINQKNQNHVHFQKSNELSVLQKENKKLRKSKQKQKQSKLKSLRPSGSKPKAKSKGKSKQKIVLNQAKIQKKKEEIKNLHEQRKTLQYFNKNPKLLSVLKQEEEQKDSILSSIAKLKEKRTHNEHLNMNNVTINQGQKKKRSVSVSLKPRISQKSKLNNYQNLVTSINYGRGRVPLTTKSINKMEIDMQSSQKNRHKEEYKPEIGQYLIINTEDNSNSKSHALKSSSLQGKITKANHLNNRIQKRRNLIQITQNTRIIKDKIIQKGASKGKQNRNSLNNQSMINSYKNKDNKIGSETSKSKDNKNPLNVIKNFKKSQNNLHSTSHNNHSQRTKMNNSVNHALQQNTSINLNHQNLTMAMSAVNGVSSSDYSTGFVTKKTDKLKQKNKNQTNFRDFVNIDADMSNQFIQEYLARNKTNKNKVKNKKPSSNMISMTSNNINMNIKIKSERLQKQKQKERQSIHHHQAINPRNL